MTEKMKYLLITAAVVLMLAGCRFDDNPTGEDVEGAGYVLAGYYMMAGDEEALSEGTSRATASTDTDRYSDYFEKTFSELVTLTASSPMTFVNYPEQGQKTYTTVTVTGDADIFKFSSRTEYPNHDDTIDYYQEVYYLKDATGTGTGTDYWYEEGVVVDDSGNEDSTYRETMEVHFKDGSVRYEWIADTSTTMGEYYQPFDLNGDMTVPSNVDWEPETQSTGMNWSSKVHYYQSIKADIGWFRAEHKEIFGVRYYTEDTSSDATSLAYEHMISQTVLNTGIDWLDSIANWIFAGGDGDGITLAETVIRYELTGNNHKKTTRTTTNIVNWAGNLISLDYETTY